MFCLSSNSLDLLLFPRYHQSGLLLDLLSLPAPWSDSSAWSSHALLVTIWTVPDQLSLLAPDWLWPPASLCYPDNSLDFSEHSSFSAPRTAFGHLLYELTAHHLAFQPAPWVFTSSVLQILYWNPLSETWQRCVVSGTLRYHGPVMSCFITI